MGVYVCHICGDVFDGDLPTAIEPHGEELPILACNRCRWGEYVEAKECKACGEYFPDNNNYGFCDTCIDENATIEMAIELGENDLVNMEINSLLVSLFTREEIEAILLKIVKENRLKYKRKCNWYCLESRNIDNYVEELRYKVRQNKERLEKGKA